MRLSVIHTTHYHYPRAVDFAPHTLYLRPRTTAHQRLIRHELTLNPAAKVASLRDAHDNDADCAYFAVQASSLCIRSAFEVENTQWNPFDFILDARAIAFPFKYTPEEVLALGAYLAPPFASTQTSLRSWLDAHFTERPGETVPSISALNQLLFQRLGYIRREEQGIQPSLVTLASGGGACRDYAVLFIELCRTLGIAARFVSGYLFAPSGEGNRAVGAMHAWAEVYLPGAGWRALDPTHGIWCDSTFIPVAHAAVAVSVNPIQGNLYARDPVGSTLHTEVVVEQIS
jgi:transglutaminase-like putative cysteine protease